MPQLDPTSFASQLFWLSVTFIGLYLALSVYIIPRIASILETRSGRIEGDLQTAARFRDEAELAKNAYEQSMKETQAKAQKLVSDAQASMTAEVAKRTLELDAELARKVTQAETAIIAAKNKALQEMKAPATDLVVNIVSALTPFKPDRALVDKALGK